MVLRHSIALTLLAAAPSLAGVDGAIEQEYKKMFEGKGVIVRIDVKIQKIKKQVPQRQTGGLEMSTMVKPATRVSPSGVTYDSEAHSTETMYAPKGTAVLVEEVSFAKSEVEFKVQLKGHPESTIITFDLGKKMDSGFSDRAVLDRMLSESFETVAEPKP